jgi:hypothetical protein
MRAIDLSSVVTDSSFQKFIVSPELLHILPAFVIVGMLYIFIYC